MRREQCKFWTYFQVMRASNHHNGHLFNSTDSVLWEVMSQQKWCCWNGGPSANRALSVTFPSPFLTPLGLLLTLFPCLPRPPSVSSSQHLGRSGEIERAIRKIIDSSQCQPVSCSVSAMIHFAVQSSDSGARRAHASWIRSSTGCIQPIGLMFDTPVLGGGFLSRLILLR